MSGYFLPLSLIFLFVIFYFRDNYTTQAKTIPSVVKPSLSVQENLASLSGSPMDKEDTEKNIRILYCTS